MGGPIPSALKGLIKGAGSGMRSGMEEYKKTAEKPAEETKQAEAKEASETKRLLRVKRKGRSSTVLSSSSGVTDEASVSKKTLLGS
jgi:hypothetical protein